MKRISIILLVLVLWTANLLSQPAGPMFRNLGPQVNTDADEYLPVVYRDTLYFRRSQKSKAEQLIMTEIKGFNCGNDVFDFNLIKSKEYVNSAFNLKRTYQTNLSTPSFSQYSDTISRWEKPKAMEELSSNANDFHPAFSITGDTLVFASNRPDPKSPSDLYVAVKRANGKWARPRKLSRTINTGENEISPYIAPDGSLYYASKGFRKGAASVVVSGKGRGKNAGGGANLYIQESALNYDIIRAELGDNFWQNPQKLEYPINTEFDEIGPAIYNSQIYFASNRNSGYDWGNSYGGFDLYGFCLDNCCDTACSKLFLSVSLSGSGLEEKPYAQVEIIQMPEEKVIKHIVIENSFDYGVYLPHHNEYKIRTYHNCLQPDGYIEQTINHECNICCIDTIAIDTKLDGSCPTCIGKNILAGTVSCQDKYFSCGGYIEVFDAGKRMLQRAEINGVGYYEIKELEKEEKYIIRYYNDCLDSLQYIEKEYIVKNFDPTSSEKKITIDFKTPSSCCVQCDDVLVRGRVSCGYLHAFGYFHIQISDKYNNLIGEATTNRFGEFTSVIQQQCQMDSLTVSLETECATGGFVKEIIPFECRTDTLNVIELTMDFPKVCCSSCNKVLVEGKVFCSETQKFRAGTIEIYSNYDFFDEDKLAQTELDSNGMFYFSVPYWPEYKIVYTSFMDKNKVLIKNVETAYPCKTNLDDYVYIEMDLQEIGACKNLCDSKILSFYRDKIFTKAHYKPITRVNLKQLKKNKHNINLPLGKQALMTGLVENNIDKKAKQIINTLRKFEECPTCNQYLIKITGYPDIEKNNYMGNKIAERINDRGILLSPYSVINKGMQMNDVLLGELRAYYTIVELQRALLNMEDFLDYADNIEWIATSGSVKNAIGNPDIEIKCQSEKYKLPVLEFEAKMKLVPLNKTKRPLSPLDKIHMNGE